ncbi:hypothetical protein NDU88_010433 [Pleurodeles waltl]|uniref:Uncharacterized protein n=1 Tax=Pleurodeles waltl TaxID=8319 RepID=A0AAV7Q1X2_PLEWA|nr:hypothetical protein NDU88_010433 [Pleurodeles waltl]
MVAAEEGSDRVTRNVSRFKKAMFVEHSGDQEAENQFPDWTTTESPEQDCESELPTTAGPGCLRQLLSAALATQCSEARSQAVSRDGLVVLRPDTMDTDPEEEDGICGKPRDYK